MKKQYKQSGFSLIEALIYVSLLVIISTAAVTSLLLYSDIIAEQKAKRLVTSNAQVVLERITREIRNADAVYLPGSTLDNPSGVLELANVGDDVVFGFNGGNVDVTVGSGNTVQLVDSEVSVDDLTFHYYSTGNTELVRTIITLTASTSISSTTETFYGAAVLRGSYD